MLSLLIEYKVFLGVFMLFIFWLVLYNRIKITIAKCVSSFTTFKLPEINKLLHSSTSALFCFISVPLCFSTFSTTNPDTSFKSWLLSSFGQMMNQCAVEERVDSFKNFKFIILYSCLLHSVYASYSEKVIDEWPILKTIKRVAVLSFFASSYCFGCTEAGFVFLGLSNLSLGTLELARLLKLFHNKTSSKIIKLFSIMQFIVHCGVWISIYLFLIPFIVISSMEILKMDSENRLPLGIMLLSLLIFYLIELRDSPLNMSTTTGNGIFRLLESPKNALKLSTNKSKEKSKENMLMLYQTTKCAMAVKKKVQQIREEKKSKEFILPSKIKQEPIEVIELLDD
ncbi:uncharacterized protein LOC126840650 [Adelges cooleyi]|uniref:uncharacterized protein LOC126840650 n=1 Tax=Adelges cooleyi TaxID=133065 RepID=UPI00217FA8F5|nr:uncharacterized protein LOC126840650 [Adelges cooleyi]XP_050432484.1 uncharacterized protein LOC126840650 [Adelges cooleyi]